MQNLDFAWLLVALASACGGTDPVHANESTKAVSQAVTVSAPGVIQAFAGTGVRGGSSSGTPALQAALDSPSGVALCPDGGLYVSDTGNNRIVKISGEQMTTVVASQTAASGALYSNLLTNPRAEAPLVDGATVPGWTVLSPPGGWTEVPWIRTRPQPLDGERYFRANSGATGEMYQDISVQSYQSEIAAGTQKFTFSAFVHSLSGDANPDTTQIIVEYRHSSGILLSKFDSGPVANRGEWQLITDTRTAPKPTGRIRVRLISTRHTGGGNDAYYDGLFLRAEPPTTTGTTVSASQTVLALPHGLSCNWQNTLYIADTYNSRVLALSWDRLTTTTMAGTGVLGFNGESGISSATQLALPLSVSFAQANDSQLFIADYLNHRIRSIDWASPTHSTTVYGGGTADLGTLNYPMGISTVPEANSLATIYVADTSNNAVFSASPTLSSTTTLLLNGPGFSDKLTPVSKQTVNWPQQPLAQTSRPIALGSPYQAPDLHDTGRLASARNGGHFGGLSLLVGDLSNHAIRHVTPDGLTQTIVGNGLAGDDGDNGPAPPVPT